MFEKRSERVVTTIARRLLTNQLIFRTAIAATLLPCMFDNSRQNVSELFYIGSSSLGLCCRCRTHVCATCATRNHFT